MTKTTLRILALVLFFLAPLGGLFSQKLSPSQLERKLQTKYQNLNIEFVYKGKLLPTPISPVLIKYRLSNYFPSERFKTIITIDQRNGAQSTNFEGEPNFDLENEYYIPGVITDWALSRSGYLILSVDTINYGKVKHVKHYLHHLSDKKFEQKRLPLVFESVFDESCTRDSYYATPTLKKVDDKEIYINVENWQGCSKIQVYQWKYEWDYKALKFNNLEKQGEAEINQYKTYNYFPEGTFEISYLRGDKGKISEVTVDDKKYYFSKVFIESENMSSKMYLRDLNLKTKEVGPISFSTDGQYLQVKMGNPDISFKGFHYLEDHQIVIEGYDEEGWYNILKLKHLYTYAEAEGYEKLLSEKYKISKIGAWNLIRKKNVSAIRYLVEKRKWPYENYQFKVGDKNEYQNSFVLAMVSGNIQLVRLFADKLDIDKHEDNLNDLAKISGDGAIQDFVDEYFKKKQQEAAEEAKKKLIRTITSKVNRNNGWYMNQAEIDVENIIDEDSLQVHNVSIYVTAQNQTHNRFDIHVKTTEGWTSLVESFNLSGGDAPHGYIQDFFNLGDDRFIYTINEMGYGINGDRTYTIYSFQPEAKTITPTNLSYTVAYDEEMCDGIIEDYEFSWDEDSKIVDVTLSEIEFMECEVNDKMDEVKSYRWSSRLGKFLEKL